MTVLWTRPLVATVLLGSGGVLAGAQSAPPVVPHYRATQTFSWDFGWLSRAWSAQGEAPYAAYRRRVDALGARSAGGDAAARREIVALAERHRDASAMAPTDPLLLFEHLYAAYMACQRDPRLWGPLGLGEGVERLKRLAPPHSREYARLLFVLENVPLPHQTMWTLGDRLLQGDSKDRRVMYLLATRLVPSRSQGERKAALGWGEALVKGWPDFAQVYAARAGIYYKIYIHDRKRDYRIQAVKDYHKYLQLAPASDPWRRTAQEIADYIDTSLRRLEKG